MKEPDPASFMMQVIYGIIGLFAFILIGGGITAAVYLNFSILVVSEYVKSLFDASAVEFRRHWI